MHTHTPSQNEIDADLQRRIEDSTSRCGKVRLVLYKQRYFVESHMPVRARVCEYQRGRDFFFRFFVFETDFFFQIFPRFFAPDFLGAVILSTRPFYFLFTSLRCSVSIG
jgi:hypothetical protein